MPQKWNCFKNPCLGHSDILTGWLLTAGCEKAFSLQYRTLVKRPGFALTNPGLAGSWNICDFREVNPSAVIIQIIIT